MTNDDLTALVISLAVASAATVLVFLIATPFAWLLARHKFRGSALLVSLLSLPLVLPPTVTGYFLLEIFGRQAPFGRLLENFFGLVLVFHWTGAVLAAAVTSFPLFFLSARSAFASVDSSFEQVARLLGASEWSIFWRVTWPLSIRGLTVGAMLAFVRALGDFGATLMVAGNIPGRTQTAALALYDATVLGQAHRARFLVAFLGGIAIAALWFTSRNESPQNA